MRFSYILKTTSRRKTWEIWLGPNVDALGKSDSLDPRYLLMKLEDGSWHISEIRRRIRYLGTISVPRCFITIPW